MSVTAPSAVTLRPPPAADRATARTRRLLALVHRNLLQYRHSPLVLLSGVFEPLMYLLSVGVGIGRLVHHVPGLDDPNLGYAAFVAPALLATAAMNDAMSETTNVFYSKLRVERVYDSVLTTPLDVTDVVLGETLWAVLRGLTAAVGFLAFAAALGMLHSAWVLLVPVCALLISFAFATVGLTVATYIRGWQDFQYVQVAMLPMFLFATTFYPLGVYPRPLQFAVEATPLFHAVELVRAVSLGHFGPSLAGHAAYLAVMGLLGLWAATRRLRAVTA
ncbi:ABC transporter permease [Streptacidiphilus cavernicola]|uniref:Transport permease protein n=1 Tax=Streptacidiphilus cavernicola TaxID=3342716 RepID=A0ABV6VSJ5_9ACTN